jgi:peptide/nickel transport system permease protein
VTNSRIRLGLALIGLLGGAALLAPLLAPDSPIAQPDILRLQNTPPSWEHPLGTDFYGRDVLSRVLYGARISLAVGFLSVLLSLTVGIATGLAAGFAEGIADAVVMRTVDAALAIPRMFLYLVVIALWPGAGVTALVLTLGLTSWLETCRLVRAQVLSLKRREFITASRALGIAPLSLLLRHVLPNVMAPIRVNGTLALGTMILAEAGLSFLGAGVQAPMPSLGNMIRDGYASMIQAPWIAIAPGIFVMLTMLAFSVLSEGLREAE